MADGTKIEWTDATVNAVNGCSVLSPGCKLCYAVKQAHRFDARRGLTHMTTGGMVWTGEVRFNETQLLKPLAWKRPRRIFWNAHGDLFHESVPDEWIDKVFAICALTPQHSHQILTKRSARMRAYMLAFEDRPEAFGEALAHVARAAGLPKHAGLDAIDAMSFPLPNVWLGVSVEDQQRADERIPDLLATPAAVRFISAEPLLGPIDLTNITGAQKSRDYGSPVHGWSAIWRDNGIGRAWLDWVIVGGESGPGARPMHPDWARSLRDQCAAAGVPFLFKQWGEWEASLDRERDDPDWRADYSNDYVNSGRSAWLNLAGGSGFHGERFHVMRRMGKKLTGRLLDGVQHDGMPVC